MYTGLYKYIFYVLHTEVRSMQTVTNCGKQKTQRESLLKQATGPSRVDRAEGHLLWFILRLSVPRLYSVD
jgi:hypothetical protein